MNRKPVGVILLAVGIVVLLVALAADLVGLGNGASFGFRQVAGAVMGALVALAGGVSLTRP